MTRAVIKSGVQSIIHSRRGEQSKLQYRKARYNKEQHQHAGKEPSWFTYILVQRCRVTWQSFLLKSNQYIMQEIINSKITLLSYLRKFIKTKKISVSGSKKANLETTTCQPIKARVIVRDVIHGRADSQSRWWASFVTTDPVFGGEATAAFTHPTVH